VTPSAALSPERRFFFGFSAGAPSVMLDGDAKAD
jgi:hypothetical protein